jgi:O-antigen/teichoic acid export membrane protein
MATGINGAIIVNSKYYRYDLYTTVLLVFVTITTNYLLIPKYGIDGAAMATAISVLLYNLIRLVLIKVKMNMHPFSLQTIYTVLLLFAMYFLLDLLPNTSYTFADIIWKSGVVLMISLPAVFYLNLSKDISSLVKELRGKFLG